MTTDLTTQFKDRITKAMAEFFKEQIGERSESITTEVIDDTVIVRFKGVLSLGERRLSRSPQGAQLINEFKERLIEKTRPLLVSLIESLTHAEVRNTHSIFNAVTGERIEIFILNRDLEKS